MRAQDTNEELGGELVIGGGKGDAEHHGPRRHRERALPAAIASLALVPQSPSDIRFFQQGWFHVPSATLHGPRVERDDQVHDCPADFRGLILADEAGVKIQPGQLKGGHKHQIAIRS